MSLFDDEVVKAKAGVCGRIVGSANAEVACCTVDVIADECCVRADWGCDDIRSGIVFLSEIHSQ